MQIFHRKNQIIKILICAAIFTALSVDITKASAVSLKIATMQLTPFGIMEEGKCSGFYYDLGNRLVEEAGFSGENKVFPYARIMRELEMGRSDFAFILPNETLDRVAHKVAEVFTFDIIVIGRKGTSFKSLQDLHGRRVATVRGARFDDAFSADDKIEKNQNLDYTQAVKMLLADRVEAAIGTRMGLYYTIQQLGYSIKDFGEPLVLSSKSAWLYFSQKSPNQEAIEPLKRSLKKLRKGNTYKEILGVYIKPE